MVFLRSRTFDFLERERLLYHREQAVKIQAHFRKYSAMNSYRLAKHAILVLQCCLRRFLAVTRVNRRRLFVAASSIQRIYRGHRTRWFVFRPMMSGFKRLQACYRGRVSREASRDYRKFYVAARTIQCMARQRAARDKLREHRLEARNLSKVRALCELVFMKAVHIASAVCCEW